MKQPDSVELGRTDLAGCLSRLACRLRNDGLALLGRASLESTPGRREYEDLAEIWNSLDRAASLLEAIQRRVCKDCQALDVFECIAFGSAPNARTRSVKKGDRKRKLQR